MKSRFQNVLALIPTAYAQGEFDIGPIESPSNLPGEIANIAGLITRVVGAALVFAAILAFLYLIWGGVQWITSGGDKQGLENARNRITNAIIGLVIVAASWAIFQLVQRILLGSENAIIELGMHALSIG